MAAETRGNGAKGRLVTAAEAAAVIGISTSALTKAMRRDPAAWPAPVDSVQGRAGGGAARRWLLADLLAVAPVTSPPHARETGGEPRDGDTDVDGLVACRECGKKFRALTRHLRVHSLDRKRYLERHGLPAATSLVGAAPTVRRQAWLTRRTEQVAANGPLRDEGGQRLLTRDEIATALGVSTRTVTALLANPEQGFPAPAAAVRRLTRAVSVWRESDIAEFAKRAYGPRQPPHAGTASESTSVITCLECGSRFLSLGPHLRRHGLDKSAYLAKHDLPAETAMVGASMQFPRRPGARRKR